MKVPNTEMMRRANAELLAHNQHILVVRWSGKEVEFSDGTILKNNAMIRFKRRIFNNSSDLWKVHHDEIIKNPAIADEVRQVIQGIGRSLGGKRVQELYGEKIKSNLNTGVSWNAGKVGLQTAWNKGLTKDTDERVAAISIARMGEGNPCFGRVHTSEQKATKSVIMKQKILEGKFTPKTNNRNTFWESSFLGKQFRSSWEAWYQYLSPESEFEVLRIQYEIDGKTKIYIVDFVDHLNKTVAEVKPAELTESAVFSAKWKALNEWAETNGYRPILVTAQWLVENTTTIDYSLFDLKTAEKIRKIYEASKKD